MLRGSDGVGSRGRGRQVPVSLGLQDLCLFNLCLLVSWFSLSCSPPATFPLFDSDSHFSTPDGSQLVFEIFASVESLLLWSEEEEEE